MAYDFCIKNGEQVPLTEATLPVTHIEFAYGFGVYENIRVVKGRALFLSDHLARLQKSAEVIGLEHVFDAKVITEWVEALIAACKADALNLKILLIGGRTASEATLFILPLAPLFPDRKLWKVGATAITVPYERSFPDAKTLSMLGSYIAYRKAKNAGAYDALLLDRDRCITEGTRTNFFAMKGRTIVGAPREKILFGVTMKHVLAVALKQNFSYEELPLHLSSIQDYDGVFLTSTSSKIMPLCRIDDTAIAIPEALRELMEHFETFLKTEEVSVESTPTS